MQSSYDAAEVEKIRKEGANPTLSLLKSPTVQTCKEYSQIVTNIITYIS